MSWATRRMGQNKLSVAAALTGVKVSSAPFTSAFQTIMMKRVVMELIKQCNPLLADKESAI